MAVWRPNQEIRVKVVGLAWRGESLLAVEVERDDGTTKGVRPPGGAIEFGETREEALRREFFEELGTGIRIVGPWHVCENIFEHHGAIGHEFVFAADVELLDSSLYQRDEIVFKESDGTLQRAAWFRPVDLQESEIDLYPNGLTQLILPHNLASEAATRLGR
jgi:8-oxo-dGTP pyrophosphatase MutT (NUDIX family)